MRISYVYGSEGKRSGRRYKGKAAREKWRRNKKRQMEMEREEGEEGEEEKEASVSKFPMFYRKEAFSMKL